ncbi:hypothetical protein [Mumia zhuanghuii]|uniref:Uncharacterized protein n=1 Tax=Mumia zhuanghuii TaxID=2585211 RepID=A0A5C4MHT7_9ACTN|nr:hypothetical protein [Mumia zhuanghuii]TNC37613.1 hypothetical protein FHE65_24905 [Mumia zhuanghuii]TNC50248.1 hypothetical protein FHE65_04005 [Mumia zhuanghuii]
MKTTPVRRGAGMIAAGALVAGALAALPMSAAQAAEATTDYSCHYTSFGPYDAALKTDFASTTVKKGESISLDGAATYAWGSGWSDLARRLQMEFKSVSATIPVFVNGTEFAKPATLSFADSAVAVPAAGNMVWNGTLDLPSIPTSTTGPVTISLGKADFGMLAKLSFSNGAFVPADVNCALVGDAPNIASVTVDPAGTLAPVAALKATGKVAVGQRLTATGGTTNPASSVSYQWLVGGKVAGSGAAYVLKPADLGKAVAVRSTATRVGYVTRVTTANVGKVAAGTFAVKGKAKITGKAKVGKKIKVKAGKAAGAKVKYQWLKNGKAIKGAKGKTLKLKKSFKGKKISVKVTYSKAGYKTVTQKTKAVKVKK